MTRVEPRVASSWVARVEPRMASSSAAPRGSVLLPPPLPFAPQLPAGIARPACQRQRLPATRRRRRRIRCRRQPAARK